MGLNEKNDCKSRITDNRSGCTREKYYVVSPQPKKIGMNFKLGDFPFHTTTR